MAELIDVLNEDGGATGITKEKSDIHRDGDWHRAAHLWIVTPAGQVLLQRRSREKENWPGLWDVSVAGHISAGESAEEAAVREAEEEIGLKISPGELRRIGTLTQSAVLNGGAYRDNEIHEIFLVRRPIDLSALTLQKGEVDEVMLLPLEQLSAVPDLVPHEGEYTLLAQQLKKERA